MDNLENKKKWKYFLSSIKSFKTLPTNNLKINIKSSIGCLANEFANRLLEKKGGTVEFTGTQEVLNHYKDLDVNTNQPKSSKGNIPLAKDESKDESKDDSDKPARKRGHCHRFSGRENDIPKKIAKTNKNVEKKPKASTANDENTKKTSPQNNDANIEEKTSRNIVISVDNIRNVSHTIEINRRRSRDTHIPSKKDAIDNACSKWNVPSIAEYLKFDACVTKIRMSTMILPYPDDIYERVQKDICLRLKIVTGNDLSPTESNLDSEFLMQLKSITSTQAGSRLVLDALLIPLCSALELQIEVDKNIDCNFLPNCRFNYCIRKEEHIIGCIEANSGKSLSSHSIAQAVLRLIVLQTTLIATETPKVDISEFPVFAIVTDGRRFIYMQLKGSSLGFEHHNGRLRIREVKEESDFKEILQLIRFLVEGDKKQG